MYSYRVFNLTISSELPLLDLERSEGSPDVVVHLGNLNNIDQQTLEVNHNLGKLSDIGTFLIKDGREIIVDPVDRTDPLKLAPSILGPAMSVILRQRGYLVLHASCVAIEGRASMSDKSASFGQQTMAIAFLGASGAGKSTFAQAFHSQGYKILTDDVMAIQFDQGHPHVVPSLPQSKLTAQAATALGIRHDHCSVLFTNADKLSYIFKHGFQETPLPLRQIYVLDKGAHHKITPLSRQTAFAELVRHTRAVNTMTAPEHTTAHLRQCARLLQAVPVAQFTRRPSLTELPALMDLVRADLAQVNQQKLRSQPLPESSFSTS